MSVNNHQWSDVYDKHQWLLYNSHQVGALDVLGALRHVVQQHEEAASRGSTSVHVPVAPGMQQEQGGRGSRCVCWGCRLF